MNYILEEQTKYTLLEKYVLSEDANDEAMPTESSPAELSGAQPNTEAAANNSIDKDKLTQWLNSFCNSYNELQNILNDLTNTQGLPLPDGDYTEEDVKIVKDRCDDFIANVTKLSKSYKKGTIESSVTPILRLDYTLGAKITQSLLYTKLSKILKLFDEKSAYANLIKAMKNLLDAQKSLSGLDGDIQVSEKPTQENNATANAENKAEVTAPAGNKTQENLAQVQASYKKLSSIEKTLLVEASIKVLTGNVTKYRKAFVESGVALLKEIETAFDLCNTEVGKNFTYWTGLLKNFKTNKDKLTDKYWQALDIVRLTSIDEGNYAVSYSSKTFGTVVSGGNFNGIFYLTSLAKTLGLSSKGGKSSGGKKRGGGGDDGYPMPQPPGTGPNTDSNTDNGAGEQPLKEKDWYSLLVQAEKTGNIKSFWTKYYSEEWGNKVGGALRTISDFYKEIINLKQNGFREAYNPFIAYMRNNKEFIVDVITDRVFSEVAAAYHNRSGITSDMLRRSMLAKPTDYVNLLSKKEFYSLSAGDAKRFILLLARVLSKADSIDSFTSAFVNKAPKDKNARIQFALAYVLGNGGALNGIGVAENRADELFGVDEMAQTRQGYSGRGRGGNLGLDKEYNSTDYITALDALLKFLQQPNQSGKYSVEKIVQALQLILSSPSLLKSK